MKLGQIWHFRGDLIARVCVYATPEEARQVVA
jgi:hypothetical protein